MWSILLLRGLCFLEDSTLMGSRTQQASWSPWGHVSPGWPHPLPYRSSLLIQPALRRRVPALAEPSEHAGCCAAPHCMSSHYPVQSSQSLPHTEVLLPLSTPEHLKLQAEQHGLEGLLKQIPGPHPQFLTQKFDEAQEHTFLTSSQMLQIPPWITCL